MYRHRAALFMEMAGHLAMGRDVAPEWIDYLFASKDSASQCCQICVEDDSPDKPFYRPCGRPLAEDYESHLPLCDLHMKWKGKKKACASSLFGFDDKGNSLLSYAQFQKGRSKAIEKARKTAAEFSEAST